MGGLKRGLHLALVGSLLFGGTVAVAVAVVEAIPASASTTNGVATTADPNSLTYVASGGSTTPFTITLPVNASCSGDTANGYHVFSYLVPEGTAVSGVMFTEFPSTGYGFVNDIGTYYGAANTNAAGQFNVAPIAFQWAPLVADDGVSLSTLLTSGSTPGVWEGGIACANSSHVLTDNWNTEFTFTSSSSDPTGFAWSAVPGPSGDQVSAISSANSTTFTEGTSDTFTPSATGTPTPTITEFGTLPGGVTYAGGVLSGTPTETGSFPITFTATNGIGNPATQDFTLTVDPAPVLCTQGNYSSTGYAPCTPAPPNTYVATTGATAATPCPVGTVNPNTGSTSVAACVALPFRITTSSLPHATPGISYGPVTLTATGQGISTSPNTTSLKWKKVNLPKGLKLSSAGVLSGTPSAKGATPTSATIQVTETVITLNGKKKVKTPTTVQATIPFA